MNKNSIALIIVISISILLVIFYQDPIDSLDLSKPPSIVSILPPVIAIAAAFLLRQVVVALFLGIWFGAWVLNGGDFSAVLTGLVDVTNKYAVNAMVNKDHAVIILASVFIGGLMSVLSANGSMQAIVKAILRRVVTIKHVQLSTFCMGLIIFFDDYANALVTGNVMRPVTDKMKISREKLAYIVDSTAAPVASVAVISLWIGFLVSLIETSIENIASLSNPYGLFIESLAYSFYPFLAIIFVLIVIISGKDFGPMLSAERKALAGELSLKRPIADQEPARSAPASIAIVSILVLIATVILGMLYTGSGDSLHEIIGSSDSLAALMFGAFLSSLVAIVFSLLKTSLTLAQVIEAWLVGINTVIGAVVILILSWSLAEVVKDMQSADFIIFIIGNDMSPALLPTIIFVLSGLVALGTGTSWGVVNILPSNQLRLTVFLSS